MKKLALSCLFCFGLILSHAQKKETYEFISYTPPLGWKKEVKENSHTGYTKVNQQNNSFCQIFVMLSTTGKGNIQDDFDTEWKNLIVTQYGVKEALQVTTADARNGWAVKTAVGSFVFNGQNCAAMLLTMSGYNRVVNIVAITNSEDYTPEIDKFLESVEMKKPTDKLTLPPTTVKTTTGAFAFTTTNFDDGWISTVQEDWVEVIKGDLKILLHYPKEGTIFPADPGPLTDAAWNILVAPRYSNLKNYKTSYISTYDRPYLGMGYATENLTGKTKFIVFFRQGHSGWLEFVCPDKNSFISQFRFDPESIQWDSNSDLLIPLANMTLYNKFAVAASDLKGKWTSDFTGIQQLYSSYTGQYAGMKINQSNEEFTFTAGSSYNWKLLAVNGTVGNISAVDVKSAGKFTVPNNWQINFSNIENKARNFHAFWSCIKGGRILNLLSVDAPGTGIYTKYGLAK